MADPANAFSGGAYFLGKALWTKGYRELWDAMRAYGGADLPGLHTFGSGPEGEEIAAAAHALPTVQAGEMWPEM